MILIPEIIGHLYFDTQKHPTNSSVVAALSLTSKFHTQPTRNISCQLTIENDTYGSHVTRAVGLSGQFGNYTCK